VLDEGGYGRYLGRNKDVIIKYADKIFPVELEEFFLNHPDVLEAVVRLQYKHNYSNTVGQNGSISTVDEHLMDNRASFPITYSLLLVLSF
jgi:hypothetical protein